MAVPHFGPRSSHQLWHNSQVNSSVTNITDNQSLAAATSNRLILASKIRSLNSSSHHYQPSLYSQLPSGTRLIRGVAKFLRAKCVPYHIRFASYATVNRALKFLSWPKDCVQIHQTLFPPRGQGLGTRLSFS